MAREVIVKHLAEVQVTVDLDREQVSRVEVIRNSVRPVEDHAVFADGELGWSDDGPVPSAAEINRALDVAYATAGQWPTPWAQDEV